MLDKAKSIIHYPMNQVTKMSDRLLKAGTSNILTKELGGSLRGTVANVLDIMVSEFELQSRHYIHFRRNTLREGMNYGLNSTITRMSLALNNPQRLICH